VAVVPGFESNFRNTGGNTRCGTAVSRKGCGAGSFSGYEAKTLRRLTGRVLPALSVLPSVREEYVSTVSPGLAEFLGCGAGGSETRKSEARRHG